MMQTGCVNHFEGDVIISFAKKFSTTHYPSTIGSNAKVMSEILPSLTGDRDVRVDPVFKTISRILHPPKPR